MTCRLTKQAEDDIAAILRKTRRKFGTRQVSAYAEIIDRGVAMVADEPARPGALGRNDIREGVKSFHLELAAKRRHGGSHILYFKEIPDKSRNPQLVILRVLHEAMEPKRRLIRALREQELGQ